MRIIDTIYIYILLIFVINAFKYKNVDQIFIERILLILSPRVIVLDVVGECLTLKPGLFRRSTKLYNF